MTEVVAIVSLPDGEEPFNSKKNPGAFSASTHKLGSSRKSGEVTFKIVTNAEVAAYLGASAHNTDFTSRHEHDRRKFELSDEHKELLQALVRLGLIKGYEWAAPRAESLLKNRAIPYLKERMIPYGAARLQALRKARKARRRDSATEPKARAEPRIVAITPQTSDKVAPEAAPGVLGATLESCRPEMSAEEARHLRAAAEAMRAWADRLDEHVDRSRVISDGELLELDGSAVRITHEQLTADRVPELEAGKAKNMSMGGQGLAESSRCRVIEPIEAGQCTRFMDETAGQRHGRSSGLRRVVEA
ncbi:hypothetical protein [Micromonospora aurantiaca (nom. illeg.)]|uniref:hypothetical protein n=1 Tax=Micromonospora aurantiaca (nom. illeg.) TaxID=47850 RepID=UPI00379D9313